MTERIFNPSSPACEAWERVLAEALDGLLRPADEAVFSAHMAICPACAALFEEARQGREWLAFLAHEPEVPAGLVERILAQTGPGHLADCGLASQVPKSEGPGAPAPIAIPVWQYPGFMGSLRRMAEPRLMMAAAMAFFSIALTLNLTGVRLSSLRLSDLQPEAMRSYVERQFAEASTPVIRFYDHSPLVRDVQMTVRELQQTTEDQGESKERRQQQDAAPGESQEAPGGNEAAPRSAPQPQQSGKQVDRPVLGCTDLLATENHSAHSGGSLKAVRERSTRWTA
jgi:hypothetical protein